jgi:hypothetical protein
VNPSNRNAVFITGTGSTRPKSMFIITTLMVWIV